MSALIVPIVVGMLFGPVRAAASEQAPLPFPAFVDVATDVGLSLANVSGDAAKDYIIETNGNGAAFFDADGDGDLDVLITNGTTLEAYASGGDPMVALYRNDAGRFVDATADSGMGTRGWGQGVCVADYDNDGDHDVYVTGYGANVLYRNHGDGTFEDVTSAARVDDDGWGTNCAFGDYDRDGDVDLYVANYVDFDLERVPRPGERSTCQYMGVDVMCGPVGLEGQADVLYRNDGDGTFTDVTREAGIDDPGHYGFGVVFSDLDNDGWSDIYVANDSVPNLLFQNDGDGTFTEIGSVSGTALGQSGHAQAGMGLAVGDYDGNGYFDLFVTNFSGDTNTLYQNLGGMLFVDATTTAGLGGISLPYLGWGTAIADFDNDGFPDVFVANGHVYPEVDDADAGTRFLQPKEIYRNLGNGRFADVTRTTGEDLVVGKSARGAAFGDYDNDGDIDIVTVNIDEAPSLYRNDGGNRQHWLSLGLEGTRSNRDAIGARVEITAGDRTQVEEVRSGGSYLSHSDMRLHFGLGSTTQVDRILVRWPNGETEEFGGVDSDAFVTLREGDGMPVATP